MQMICALGPRIFLRFGLGHTGMQQRGLPLRDSRELAGIKASDTSSGLISLWHLSDIHRSPRWLLAAGCLLHHSIYQFSDMVGHN